MEKFLLLFVKKVLQEKGNTDSNILIKTLNLIPRYKNEIKIVIGGYLKQEKNVKKIIKKDFICVNGYNEQMIGWGKEDTELSVRLMNKGLQKYKLKFKAICYHLHHHISSREELNINNTILNETISTKKTRCNKGINQYANRD